MTESARRRSACFIDQGCYLQGWGREEAGYFYNFLLQVRDMNFISIDIQLMEIIESFSYVFPASPPTWRGFLSEGPNNVFNVKLSFSCYCTLNFEDHSQI